MAKNKDPKKLSSEIIKILRRIMSSRFWRTAAIMVLLIILFNILTVSEGFCNFFTADIMPLFLNTYGRFSDIFPFSFGEILIILALLLIIAVILVGILLIFLRKKKPYVRFCKIFYKTFLMIILSAALLMTFNCSIPYGCSELEMKKHAGNYSISELETLRNYLVEICNEYADSFPRDAYGRLIYDPDVEEINEEARRVMHLLAKDFPRLKGYYPDMKPIMNSTFMSQSYTLGIYFPFSLESNYNTKMYVMNYAATFCHEYSHLKGYMQEDEANFIAFLACLKSEDPYFIYSGYLSVLFYVDDAYWNNIAETDPDRYYEQAGINDEVYTDSCFLTPETWKEVEESAVFDTQVVDNVTTDFTEGYMEYYGIEDGMASYGRVADLLLQYYDGKLY
ncbi:MAG: DUF3810 domain-containing protein [Eubacterium sp.]|nr:DUF3810 domain-containing protein [Eubacterium sp.]